MTNKTFTTAELLTRDILRIYPETRQDDKLLILKFWEVEGLELTPKQKEFFLNCTSAETIRRSRQKIQEFGDYLPDHDVSKMRKARQIATSKHFSEAKKEKKPIRYDIVGNKAIPVFS